MDRPLENAVSPMYRARSRCNTQLKGAVVSLEVDYKPSTCMKEAIDVDMDGTLAINGANWTPRRANDAQLRNRRMVGPNDADDLLLARKSPAHTKLYENIYDLVWYLSHRFSV